MADGRHRPHFSAQKSRDSRSITAARYGPQRAAILELAKNRVVVVNHPQVNEAGEVFPLRCRQVPSPPNRPHDLIDQIEMVEEQSLIIHVELLGDPPDYQ